MRAGPLRQNEETAQYKSRDNRRGKRAAQCKATMVYRLVEEITNGRAQRPGQNKCRPEQRYPGYIGPAISSRDNRQRGAKYKRSAFVSEAGRIGHPVTERGS